MERAKRMTNNLVHLLVREACISSFSFLSLYHLLLGFISMNKRLCNGCERNFCVERRNAPRSMFLGWGWKGVDIAPALSSALRHPAPCECL
jgi:hypothetical protein